MAAEPRRRRDARVAAARRAAAGADLAGGLCAGRRATGAPLRDALLAFAFGWAENMVQAAMTACRWARAPAQRMLARLIEALPGRGASRPPRWPTTQRQAFTPMLAILSAQHETQYSRLFRS